MDRYLRWVSEHLSFIFPKELASLYQKIKDLEAQLSFTEATRLEVVQARDSTGAQLSQVLVDLERANSSSNFGAPLLEEKALHVTSLSYCVQDLDRVVALLRSAFHKLEREKIVVVLALKFSTSWKLPFQIKILKKNSKIADL